MGVVLMRAHFADQYRKRLGRSHPKWGNGSLAQAVLADGPLAKQPFLSEPGYLEATAEAIHAVVEWRRRQNLNT
jgi:hypothetical protein